MALCLTAGITVVSASTAAASSCPVSGQRFKKSATPKVYLIGPGGALYYFATKEEYFKDYDSYDGIMDISNSTWDSCYGNSVAYELTGGLAKAFTDNKVYISDYYYYGYRWIVSMAVFDKYGFSRSKIQLMDAVVPIATDAWWG